MSSFDTVGQQAASLITKVPGGSKNPNYIYILHLTDLHFQSAFDDQMRPEFLGMLEQALQDDWKKESGLFDLIVVTGDIADNAALYRRKRSVERVFESAKKYLESLCQREKIIPSDGLIVVAGNHDLRWKGLLRFQSSTGFFRKVFGPYMRHRYLSDMKLLVACFDSNYVRNRYEAARGAVPMSEFGFLGTERANLPGVDEALRLALVHHHPLPVSEAEDTKPVTWYEKLMRRRLVGAPETMLLRNSGAFLKKLLEHDFRLVLHGHLHYRGYWRAHNTTSEGRERWLEVISGGSAGQPPLNSAYSFGVMKIYTDGYTEYVHRGFDGVGNTLPPLPVSLAPYEIVRTRGRMPRGSDRQPIHCHSFVKSWYVDIATTDLITTDVIRGMSSATDENLSQFLMRSAAKGLTSSSINAEVLAPDVVVTIHTETKVTPEGVRRAEYRSEFEPQLQPGRGIDLTYHRRSDGSIFRSKEDQRNMGVKESSGNDWLEMKVDFQCDQLLVRLRFVGEDAGGSKTPWVPPAVRLEVKGPDGSRRRREETSGHVVLDYRIGQPGASLPRLSAEAVLSIQRPRIGHSYGLHWKLPDWDDIPDRDGLTDLRDRLLNLATVPSCQQAADRFAEDCRKICLAVASPTGRPPHERDLHAYLYAFDQEKLLLICRGSSSSPTDPMSKARFRYGHDLIGTAFRRRDSIAFLKSEHDSAFNFFEQFPKDELQSCIACPLNWPSDEGWPVGVLAIASAAERDSLEAIIKNPQMRLELFLQILGLWHKRENQMCLGASGSKVARS